MSEDTATKTLDSMADATELLTETRSSWDLLYTLGLAQTIMAIVPVVNWFTGGITWILALVNVIMFMDVSTNMTSLAAFFNSADNWKDPAAYEAAQTLRKTNYAEFDESLADEKNMLAFEEGGMASGYSLPFYIALTGPLTFVVSIFTFGLGGIALYLTCLVMNILIFIGLITTNGPITMLSWMPEEGAAPAGGDAAPKDGDNTDDQ